MKVKYKYGIHHLTDTYPTTEDALFDICSYLHERDRMSVEWSNLGIKPAFHGRVDEQDIDKLLAEIAKQGFLYERHGSGKRNYYKILKHIFPTFGELVLTDTKKEQATDAN